MLSDWLSKIKKEQVIVVIIVGILFLIVAYPGLEQLAEGEKQNGEGDTVSYTSQVEEENLQDDYVSQMEERLTKALEQIDQVGRVEVFITVKESGEQIVEKDTATTRSTNGEQEEETIQETTITADTQDGAAPFVKKSVTPRIEGVLVVAEGGGNQQVINEITDAVAALFSIEVHKIKVVRMKEGTK